MPIDLVRKVQDETLNLLISFYFFSFRFIFITLSITFPFPIATFIHLSISSNCAAHTCRTSHTYKPRPPPARPPPFVIGVRELVSVDETQVRAAGKGR